MRSQTPGMRVNPRFEIFAVTAPGLESITAGELHSLGIKVQQEIGGVSFAGDMDSLYSANLSLRTASRVVVRLGRFHATTFYELERRAKKIAWQQFLPGAGPVQVRVTCRKSRLYHSDAVAERILSSIARVAPPGVEARPGAESGQLFVVRIVDDQVEISADSSGELLHRRGYRQQVAKAPLRETLAAAMLLASGWTKDEPLLDPMCGSGTIPIEAALLARGIPPGLNRSFAFMEWPGFDSALWSDLVARAKERIINPPLRIMGSDRDAGAIEASLRNAERAGVAADIQFSTGSVSSSLASLADTAEAAGWILTNPPYGVRVGESADLRDLYATLGAAVKERPNWRLGVLIADDDLANQLRARIRARFASSNGGIPVKFVATERVRAHVVG
jgi:putative N6-adenine-specific DNA methylase